MLVQAIRVRFSSVAGTAAKALSRSVSESPSLSPSHEASVPATATAAAVTSTGVRRSMCPPWHQPRREAAGPLRAATVRRIDGSACGGSRVLAEPGKRGPVFVVSLVALVTGLGMAAWAVVEPQPAKYIVGVVLVAAGLAIQLYRARGRGGGRGRGARRTGWRRRIPDGGRGRLSNRSQRNTSWAWSW